MGWQDAPLVEDVPAQQPAYLSAPEVAPAQPATPEPTMGQVAANAVPKGIANFLNTPITLSNLIMQGIAALPGAGHLTGLQEAAANPELKANGPMDAMKEAGLVRPEAEPQTGPQRIVDMAIQAAIGSAAVPAGGVAQVAKGAVVGATSGAAAQTTKELTGSDLLAVAVGAGSPFAIKALTDSSKKIILPKIAQDTLKEAQEVGYVVEPSKVRGPTSNLEKVAGKAAIAQESVYKNQELTNRLAAEDLGLPGDTPLSMGVIEDLRKVAGRVYQEVADVSPTAKKALDGLQQARFEAADYYRYYFKTGDPQAGKEARRWQAKADAFEKLIETEAKKIVDVYGAKPSTAPAGSPNQTGIPAGAQPLQLETREVGFPLPSTGGQSSSPGRKTINVEKIGETTAGAPDLLERLKAARMLIAKTHDVERSLNLGDGNVSAPIIGKMLDQGRPLTGNLALIGRFAQAFPRSAREVASTAPPGPSATDAIVGSGLGMGGAATAGPVGIAAAGLPLLRGPARNKVLSPGYQKDLLTPPKPPTPAGVTAGRATITGTLAGDQE